MKTERFKIKNADFVEIELKVVTEDNVRNPEIPHSFSCKSIESGHKNYNEINQLLSFLIQMGILIYDKQAGNEHVFKRKVAPNSNEFTYEKISVGPETQFEVQRKHGGMVDFIALPSNYEGKRTLENMLYAVCLAHNIPAPAIITPKNMFMRMYNRVMYPATPDAEITSAIATLTVGAAVVAYCGIRAAYKLRS